VSRGKDLRLSLTVRLADRGRVIVAENKFQLDASKK
jgi:hypothetical protein